MASILPNGRVQFIDQNGKPLVAGSVTFYEPGTTTKKDTFQDSAMTEPNTNPVVLDSRGQATIWGSGTYRQIVQDVFGVTIWDQVVSSAVTSVDLAGSGGAAMIGLPDGSNLASAFELSINRTVDSIAALRALNHTFYQRAFVTGDAEPTDGGGGAYQYDPDDTSSLDNGATIIVANDGARWKLQGASAGKAYSQIPLYPQTFGAYATRQEGGRGGMASLAKGAIGAYASDNNPVFSSQLWTEFNETIGVNWTANMKVQTTVGPNSNAFTAGIFSEILSYAPNNAEQIAIVGNARAQAARNASGTGSGGDLWGGWFDANNQGYLAHCIGIEVNATNQYANWMESATPLQTDPTDFTFGIQVYPDWSTFHNSRAISIRPNATVGWSTGILVTGFVDQGLWIDSQVAWRDPPNNTQAAQPTGIFLGQNIVNKIGVQKGTGTPWVMRSEGSFLLWRANLTQWYYGMDSNDSSLSIATGSFKFYQTGRMVVGNNGILGGNEVGGGISIVGDMPHQLAMSRTATTALAPGQNMLALRVVSGTTPGTLKIVAYAGTSNTATLIADNIGAGNT
ncbi:hypothetical protein [Burkholderia gladioli]|uniref:hypothetical protein n=1 Tax=Burkholderia gladioli TaxID=28095 RepID=UPI00163EF880|nr:hypothetical protein [Burkholderia gladioli]